VRTILHVQSSRLSRYAQCGHEALRKCSDV
jgi:hypothetical protein